SGSKSANLITIFVLIGAILGFGMWVGFKWSGKDDTATQQKMANIQPQPVTTPSQGEQAREQTPSASNDNAEISSTSPKQQDANHASEPVDHNTVPATVKLQLAHNTTKSSENRSAYETSHQTKQHNSVKDPTSPKESEDNWLSNKSIQQNDVAANNLSTQPEKQDPPAEV